ncbi:hypothetical protein F2P45_09035 [Massilia sp. CCM 8733]|uniref:Uncharacterized protein n=1 Tax=Massilia mucilaginosa TaxID=2609282 RepID=A0ABX0NQU8_9BURK|nr:hypothetical protein [Massilia mucilaginosa]NHZ89159.1 hypothetical protein [Massilia mucilaginosa]
MTLTQLDIEAFAKTSDRDAVLALLATVIGPLERDDDLPEDYDLRIYKSGGMIVVLQAMEDGLISVWVRGASPWPSSPALGRYLAAQLHCLVLCDPEAEYPEISQYADVFLQIEGDAESLIPLE